MLSQKEIIPYIIAYIPSFFKGCIAVCILGMAMSTADSYLHICSIMVSHDILENIRRVKPITDTYKILVAKLSSLIGGLLAMMAAIYYNDLFKLAHRFISFITIGLNCTTAAPFILAVFGFQGTSRTFLIGIVIGILSIFIWRKLFPEILLFTYHIGPIITTGLAMMASYYLLAQSADKGWMKRNDQQKRIQKLIQAFKMYKKRVDQE
ncbi:sodium:solute symporter family transporter [Cardinium endosymbiont of Oedothorax gibbosus]|uniref:sodium:solute symporter family transporter n=1 Tax=Cardinium endosymbiont of Oedothorax gibbosus TaxID=931101 RepID=UPI002A4E26B5|nr:hypothetical protein [Cardinium endosymbiont of Oedothorax gibbosus]